MTAACATLLAGLALSCIPAAAQATYIYTGHNFTSVGGALTTSDHVSATMQLTSRLPPNQVCMNPKVLPGFTLAMTDGKDGTVMFPTLSGIIFVSTDASGAITKPWALQFVDTATDRVYFTINTDSVCGTFNPNIIDGSFPFPGDFNSGEVFNSPGTWSSPSPTIQLTMLKTQFQVGTLPDVGTSFTDQLQQVLNDIAGNNGLACSDLQIFAAHVNAQAGKKLTTQQAADIRFVVSQVAGELGCPN